MKHVDLNFSTDLTNRNQALNAIALEIKQAFNLVAAGLGDEIDAKAREQFPASPISFAVDVRPYAPGKNGYAHFTMIWAPLVQVVDDTDPENPVTQVYGYLIDLRMDLSGSTVTFDQFKKRLLARWKQTSKRKRTLQAWKKALRNARRTKDGLPDDGKLDYEVVTFGDVCFHLNIEYPKHRFAGAPASVVEETEEEEPASPSIGAARSPRRRRRTRRD